MMPKSKSPTLPLESAFHVLADPSEAATTILQDLSKAENELQENLLISIIKKHNQTLDNPDQEGGAFLYMGTFYASKKFEHGPMHKLHNLHSSLHNEMEAYLDQKTLMTGKMEMVKPALFLMIKTANTEQELRDNLPDCLLQYIKGLSSLSRYNEPAYLVQKIHMPIIEEASETIETLTMLRFMV